MQDEQRNFGVIVTSAMPAAFQSELEPWIERENKRILLLKIKTPLSALIDGLRDLIIYKHLKNAELSKRLTIKAKMIKRLVLYKRVFYKIILSHN